jgi:hypothetical protein
VSGMRRMARAAAILIVASTAATFVASAAAAPIYRCGQTYTQTPCPGGRLVDSSDPRTAAQRAEAKRVAEREKKLAAQMERERVAKEKAAKPASANGFDARAAPAPEAASTPAKAKKRSKSKSAAGKDFVALEPAGKTSSR